MKSSVSYIIPFSQDEPLFTLSSNEQDPKIGPELRARILGFGQAALKEADVKPRDMVRACHSVLYEALECSDRNCLCTCIPEHHEAHCDRTPRRFPDKMRIFETARIFLGLHDVDKKMLEELESTHSKFQRQKACAGLVPLLLSLSRVRYQDLKQCADLPLSIKVYQKQLNSDTNNSDDSIGVRFPDITESFDILAQYLLGQRYSESFIGQALLVSDHGWSIFFDALDATDPFDVSICNLRVLAGAPSIEDASKDRIVKDRILDGPTELSFSYSDSTVLKAKLSSGTSSVNFFPGVSTAKRGKSLVGFRDNDAFLARQSFTWKFKGREAKTHILGFREMLDLCKSFTWLLPCACSEKGTQLKSFEAGQILILQGSNVVRVSPETLKDYELLNSEYAVCLFPPNTRQAAKKADGIWMFNVTKNPAARWLQMDDMIRNTAFWEESDERLFIRDNETCMPCAYRFFYDSGEQHLHSLVFL